MQCLKNQFRSGTAHGGGGYILSVGLLRLYPFQRAADALSTMWGCSGGDCLLTRILWFSGQAFTDPGPGIMNKDRAFLLFDNYRAGQMLETVDDLVLAGDCDNFCRQEDGPSCASSWGRVRSIHTQRELGCFFCCVQNESSRALNPACMFVPSPFTITIYIMQVGHSKHGFTPSWSKGLPGHGGGCQPHAEPSQRL